MVLVVGSTLCTILKNSEAFSVADVAEGKIVFEREITNSGRREKHLLMLSMISERKMQPACGRFARSDLDRQIASTLPCPLESGPSSRFVGQSAIGTRRVAGTTHTESGRR